MRFMRLLALLLGIAGVVAACGGNDAGPAATSGTAPAPTSAPTSVRVASGEVARLFDYDRRRPLAITRLPLTTNLSARELRGVGVHSITYASPKGGKVPALVVVPRGKGPFPGVIVQHGLPSTKEAMLPVGIDLARTGAVVVLVDAPFNRPRQGTVRGDINLIPEDRIKAYVLTVGDGGLVRHFTGPDDADGPLRALPQEDAERWLAAMRPIEPINFVGRAAPAVLLFQAGTKDERIPRADARRYHQAASQPKEIRWYEAGHELNCTAREDMMAWLARHIGIDPRRYRCPP